MAIKWEDITKVAFSSNWRLPFLLFRTKLSWGMRHINIFKHLTSVYYQLKLPFVIGFANIRPQSWPKTVREFIVCKKLLWRTGNPFLLELWIFGCYDNKFTNKTTSRRNFEVRWSLSFILHVQTNQLIGYKRGRKLVKRCNKETIIKKRYE